MRRTAMGVLFSSLFLSPATSQAGDLSEHLYQEHHLSQVLHNAVSSGIPLQQALEAILQRNEDLQAALISAAFILKPTQADKTLQTAVSTGFSIHHTVHLAMAAAPQHCEAILDAAVGAGADEPRLIPIALRAGADPIRVVKHAIINLPERSREIIRTAESQGVDRHELLVAALEAGADPSQLTEATAAGFPSL